MAIKDDAPVVYTIPDNFIDEGRVFKGMFKTRNLIEGIIMAAVVAIFAMMVPIATLTSKITFLVIVCFPVFLVGLQGYNGDPISVTLRNAMKWRKERTIMLYNGNVRALTRAPLDTMMEQDIPRDKIIDYIEKIRTARAQKANDRILVEGVDFEFEYDDHLIINTVQKPETKPKAASFSHDDENNSEAKIAENVSLVFDNDITIAVETKTAIHQTGPRRNRDGIVAIKPDVTASGWEEGELF